MGPPRMLGESSEHVFLGDSISLKEENGSSYKSATKPFNLRGDAHNVVRVTYGEINALAGDFYATKVAISGHGKPLSESKALFVKAYNTLAHPSYRTPGEVQSILSYIRDEVEETKPHHPGGAQEGKPLKGSSVIYEGVKTWDFEQITKDRPHDQPTYLQLSRCNFDHFGQDAWTSYGAGHAVALEAATKGDLAAAYAMNAFADHFLQDSFASGHLRVPRRVLHGVKKITLDYCAKMMHDEDNKNGLHVKNKRGDSFIVYGDKMLFQAEGNDMRNRCVEAVQASADEIYEAYKSKTVPPYESYRAWQLLPTIESACDNSSQPFKALFLPDGRRRKNKDDPKCSEYVEDWTTDETLGFWTKELVIWLGGEHSGTWADMIGQMEHIEETIATDAAKGSSSGTYNTDL